MKLGLNTTEQRELRQTLIKTYRERIKSLKVEEDHLFATICKRLGVKSTSREGDLLFDFLFNGGFGNIKTPTQLEKLLCPADIAVNQSTSAKSSAISVPKKHSKSYRPTQKKGSISTKS